MFIFFQCFMVLDVCNNFKEDFLFISKGMTIDLQLLIKFKNCTTKIPFRSPTGDIYQQEDGVSIGTPFGPTFANFHTRLSEKTVFINDPSMKQPVYCRYMVYNFFL